PGAAGAAVDESGEPPLASLLALGAHHPMRRRPPVPGRLSLEVGPRLLVAAESARERGREFDRRLLERVDPGPVLVARFVGRQARPRHAAGFDQPLDVADVHPAPDALRLPRAEANREAVVVQAMADTVDPPEAERFVERLPVGEAAIRRMGLEDPDGEI